MIKSFLSELSGSPFSLWQSAVTVIQLGLKLNFCCHSKVYIQFLTHLTRTDGGRPSALTGWVGLSIFSSKSRKEANKCISNNSTFNLSPNIVL